ncbi:MAG: DUF4440 domain-containing protein [Anaerolineales bacterium]|nr:DUF4440 domain-containing protein [Anaerolineales bacterium]
MSEQSLAGGCTRRNLLAYAMVGALGLTALDGSRSAFAATEAPAESTTVAGPGVDTTADHLVRRYWDLVKKGDRSALAAFLSPAFQVVRTNGVTEDVTTYLDHLPHIEHYAIDGVHATCFGDAMVVTYSSAADGTVDGKRLLDHAAPRLTVFLRTDGVWRLLAHANLASINC